MKKLEAKELRIGNWILNPNNTFCTVGYETIRHLVITTEEVKHKPIPLTEEILLKCGFEKDGDLFRNSFGLYILVDGNKFRTCIYGCFLDMNFLIDEFEEIKYLHTLQNLVFAVFGEELEVNLDNS